MQGPVLKPADVLAATCCFIGATPAETCLQKRRDYVIELDSCYLDVGL